MEPEFWIQRWRANEIGFHKHEYNQHMTRFIDLLALERGDHVLVPLCGKSRDMLWLADHDFQVTGIEISPLAVQAFFEENALPYKTEPRSFGMAYLGERITILCADLFAIQAADLPAVAAVYDRASLIALPRSMRTDYVEKMTTLVADTVRCLLITLDYPQQEMDGPPFAVSPGEVEQLYSGRFSVERVYSEDCLADEPRFRQRGLTRLDEHVFLLIRNIP